MLTFLSQPQVAEAKKIYSPFVEKGELEFEYQLDYAVDADPAKNGSSKHQFELEYGLTERWQTAIYGVFAKNPGGNFRYNALKLESIYQMFEKDAYWLNAGLYFEYLNTSASINSPDSLEIKLLLEKQYGRLVNKANITLKKELGAHARGATFGYSWQTRWQWRKELEPGVELYSSLGELRNINALSGQSHLVGPVLFGKLGEMKYELGYLFGLTTGSTDGVFKAVLSFEF